MSDPIDDLKSFAAGVGEKNFSLDDLVRIKRESSDPADAAFHVAFASTLQTIFEFVGDVTSAEDLNSPDVKAMMKRDQKPLIGAVALNPLQASEILNNTLYGAIYAAMNFSTALSMVAAGGDPEPTRAFARNIGKHSKALAERLANHDVEVMPVTQKVLMEFLRELAIRTGLVSGEDKSDA